MSWWKSFDAKLYMAFTGVALLILFSTGFAIYSFDQFGDVVDKTAEETIPEMLVAMQLAERSAFLAAIAPVLVASEEVEQLYQTDFQIDKLLEDINSSISFLSSGENYAHSEVISQIRKQSKYIGNKLTDLQDKTLQQLLLKKRLQIKWKEIQKIHNDFVDTVSPVIYGTTSLTSLFGKRSARQIVSAIKKLPETNAQEIDSSYKELIRFTQESVSELTDDAIKNMGYALDIKAEGNLLFAMLHAAVDVDQKAILTDISNRFKGSRSSFRHAISVFETSSLAQRNPILANNVGEIDKRITSLSEGIDSIFAIREDLINGREELHSKLSEVRDIASGMTEKIENLAITIRSDMENLQEKTINDKHTSELVLFLICAGSLLSSSLIAGFTIRVLGRHERDIRVAKEDAENAQKTTAAVNEKIISSIQYANKIQRSLLPNPEDIKSCIRDSFFIWKPRDIVGGDILYYDSFSDTNNAESGFILSVIDCTGHGVPGAFMTIIASFGLRKITRDEGCHDPAEILRRLNFFIKTSLHQDKDYTRSDDGLDAAICVINPAKKSLTYAGAKIPLVYVYNGEATVIKGDKKSIGYKRSDIDFNFTNHSIKIENNASFYMCSDGFTDQLGGEPERCFGNKKLRDFLKENVALPFEIQGERLTQAFEEHRGKHEQVDDVTVVGFSVT